ncbi:MAG: endonuclease III [Alphaproteobacteria bacterium GM7ARS4]|nr:endonuclease III [Alphaproteobacteria bacterium GM7ARS4]
MAEGTFGALRASHARPSQARPSQARPSHARPSHARPSQGSEGMLSAEEVESLFRHFEDVDASPKGELFYTNSYTLLVAVVLSAQATDKAVNGATKGFFGERDSPEKMLQWGLSNLQDAIKTIGLYRSKARYIMALSRQLLERHGGEVPCDRDALQRLSGVGRKTANVVLNIFFGMPTIAVDTHIFRVSNRMGLARGKTPQEVEEALEARVPSWAKKRCHHWLILHGRYTCLARVPRCGRCVAYDVCMWPHKAKR